MKTNIEVISSVREIESTEEEYVYDVETADNEHTFIANDILVHNSLFFHWKPIIESAGWKGDTLDFILNLYEMKIKDFHLSVLRDFADMYGVDNIHDFEIEKVAESIMFLSSKRYIMHMSWEEGQKYERLKEFVFKGVELVKSSTPKFVRERISDLIKVMFENPEHINYSQLLRKVKDLKKEFMLAPIEEISFQTGTNTYLSWVIDDKERLMLKKACPIGVRAAAIHNHIISNSEDPVIKGKYMLINPGTKVKYFYTKDSNIKVFAFNRGFYPSEIAPEIDYDFMFKKAFLNTLNKFTKAVNLPEINDRISLVMSLF